MPAGILNKNIIDYQTQQSLSVTEVRERLLSRNLPPPIPNSLKDTEFVSYFGDLGRVVNSNNFNEYVRFDEENTLDVIGDDERVLHFFKNKYVGSEYDIIEYVFPASDRIKYPSLEDEYNKYNASTSVKRSYPTGANADRFKLISFGDEIGRRDPYFYIQTSDVTTDSESFLGIIGKEQLNSAILNRQAQVEESQFIQPNKTLSSIKGNENVKSFDITIPKDNVDKTKTFINYLQGSEIPYSQLPDEAVGWQEFSKPKGDVDNVMNVLGSLGVKSNTALSTEGRVNELLSRTSDGQKLLLYSNLSMNKFIPKYEDPRLSSILGTDAPTSRYYIGDDRSTNRGDTLTKTFKPEQFNDSVDTDYKTTVEDDFFWKLDGEQFNPDTLLGKTQKIVNDDSGRVFINQTDRFFKDTVKDKYIARGSAIKRFDEDATSFFRTWTVEDGYSYENAIRRTGIRRKIGDIGRDKGGLSVLQQNGMVKTHPTTIDRTAPLKKFMLSIENLAWSDNLDDLPPCERGNGDPISGNKGRLMWFAPYDLQFDENVSANWTATDFIGRGEPIYTYNNTKRSGQLRFKMIVDHPIIINEFRGRQSNLIEKLFAGGRSVDEFIDNANLVNVVDLNTRKAIELGLNAVRNQFKSNTYGDSKEVKAYFTTGSDELTSDAKNNEWVNGNSDGSFNNIVEQSEKNKKDDTPMVRIEIVAFASVLETDSTLSKTERQSAARKISDDRSNAIFKQIITTWPATVKYAVNIIRQESRIVNVFEGELNPNDQRAEIRINFEPASVEGDNQVNQDDLQIDPEKLSNLSIDECNFFDIVDQNYPNYFNTISEKIRYFHPGFHSQTPEGLNSRMTFLQQCMRQGPSVYDKGDEIKPQNLAFGRPPICILRIGDFFYSKIVINSLSLNYGAGGSSPQWDLNPEGIGVQPMMVDVNLSIDIIGGQTLTGPLNRLQNALSFNFYANTEMYDKRSDTIVEGKIINGEKPSAVPPPKTSNITETSDGDKKEPLTNEEKNKEKEEKKSDKVNQRKQKKELKKQQKELRKKRKEGKNKARAFL
jgi:hypothetical protein